MTERRPPRDDRPSDAVLDELLRAFQVDDLTQGRDVDLDSPEVEALLSGETTRPSAGVDRPPATDGVVPPDAGPDADRAPHETPNDDDAGTPDDGHENEDADADTADERTGPSMSDGGGVPSTSGAKIVRIGGDGVDDIDDPGFAGIGGRGRGQGAPAGTGTDEESDVVDHEPADRAATGGDRSGDGGGPVVIAADDGADDPVYVDGSLTPGQAGPVAVASGSSKVFIDDQAMGESDTIASAEAARATGIEPKLRERRVAVERAEGRKRLRWVVVAVAVVVVLVAGLAVLGSSLFTIGDVRVEGANDSDGETLAEIVDDLGDENIWGVDLSGYRRRVERIPQVADVRITKGFFGGATIEIAERRPVAAFAGADGRYRVIDAEGRVLRIVEQRPPRLVLVVTSEGEETPNTEPGSFAEPGFGNAGVFASMLTPAVAGRLEAVVVARDGSETRLQLTGGSEVAVGDGTDAVAKLSRLENAIVQYGDELPAYLDVSTDEVTEVAG